MLEATLPPVYGCKPHPYPRLAREEAPRHGGQEATVVKLLSEHEEDWRRIL
jgi:hypothetical protein